MLAAESAVSFADSPFASLAIALLLGLLVGMQRERTNSRLAGVRTFALITVLGTGAALAAVSLGAAWVVPAALVGVAALLVAGNFIGKPPAQADAGLTTEIAALVMFCVGAMLGAGERGIPAAVGGGVAVLLQLKRPLHRFIKQLGDRDVRAIMQFALISAVILPVLPDRDMGPYNALNPRQVWTMVVLIVGISLVAYIAYKFLRARAGNLLEGALGGLISSTATTVSSARRAKGSDAAVPSALMVITLASTVAYARVLVMIGVVAPGTLGTIGPPIGIMIAVMALLSLVVFRRSRADPHSMPEQENPTDLRPALMFGAIYAVVLVGSAAARSAFGENALYAVAGVAGLVDMDAITLSTARLAEQGAVDPDRAWRAIVIASIANLLFKAGSAWVIGGARLGARVSTVFGATIAAGAALMWLW